MLLFRLSPVQGFDVSEARSFRCQLAITAPYLLPYFIAESNREMRMNERPKRVYHIGQHYHRRNRC